jgi:hypothetical protein
VSLSSLGSVKDLLSSCRMGISEVLGHQSELTREVAAMRDGEGSKHSQAAVVKLSSIQTALLTQRDRESSPQSSSRSHQQLLLSLAELQREVDGSERHRERQQAALDRFTFICEVMQAQLQNAGELCNLKVQGH